ncbi:hypothetical protein IFM89_017272 [Coptis chinensis]|uniref:Apple domain-containing protein n=1 Tax=Coptis chinensis TaxID=261450 RepID=A0A835IDB1_9MAGN|nr:hypothetical protein IFM89_017272 [Coptis chinensis]
MEGLFASIESNPPQIYYRAGVSGTKQNKEPSYVKFLNGSLALFILNYEPNPPDTVIPVPLASSSQYMKLGGDEHLRVFEWLSRWKEVADILTGDLGGYRYPMVCGNYGICSNGMCSCLGGTSNDTSYFRLLNDRQSGLGCSSITPLSCEAPQYHRLLEVKDAIYFYYPDNITNTDIESCKQACLNNCSCNVALFQYGSNDSNGNCFMPPQLFSLMNNEKDKTHYNSSNFHQVVLLRLRKVVESDKEDYLDHVPGMPTRFTYEQLKLATESFVTKLGLGGFGSVFEGTLIDGTKVAVKCLDGIGQVNRSFLAEVETIGSIYHVNLVLDRKQPMEVVPIRNVNGKSTCTLAYTSRFKKKSSARMKNSRSNEE